MPMPASRCLLKTAVPPVAALTLAAALTGCRTGSETGPVGTAPAATITSSAPAAADPSTASPAAPASQPQTPGSLSVSVTSPVRLSGSTAAPISCAAGLSYRSSLSRATVNGDQVSFSVTVARYRGPGRYDAVVAVTLRQASGEVTAVAGVSQVPVTITTGGGSYSVSATGSDGRTLTGSLTWTCGT